MGLVESLCGDRSVKSTDFVDANYCVWEIVCRRNGDWEETALIMLLCYTNFRTKSCPVP